MKPLKSLILFCTAILLPSVVMAAKAKAPEWTVAKPAVRGFYTGVGSAPLSSADNQKLAKERALADLISEIEIKIENNSLLERMDENGNYSERHTDQIRSQAKAWLEGYELVDTYNDGSRYWVYYRLNRDDYADLKKRRSAEAGAEALSYWKQGNRALDNGRFDDAAQLYCQGIKSIEPFADQRLTVDDNGRTMNIGPELLYALSGMFSTITVEFAPEKLRVKPFNAESADIKVGVKTNGKDLNNIAVKAKMDSGTAKITVRGRTDRAGNVNISVSDVSAKPAQRHITVTPVIDIDYVFDTPALKEIGDRLKSLIRSAVIPVEIEDSQLKAVCTTTDMDAGSLSRAIASFINNNYFDIVDDEAEADLRFSISTRFRKGNVVQGDMYPMREYFISTSVLVTDLNAKTNVTTVVIDEMRTLAPEKASVSKARTNAHREVLKKLKKALDRQLLSSKFKRRDGTRTDTDYVDWFSEDNLE